MSKLEGMHQIIYFTLPRYVWYCTYVLTKERKCTLMCMMHFILTMTT